MVEREGQKKEVRRDQEDHPWHTRSWRRPLCALKIKSRRLIEGSPAVTNDSGAQRWPVKDIGPSDWSRLQGQGSWASWNFGLDSPSYTCPRRKCQHLGIHNHQPIRNSLLDILSPRGIQRALSLRMPVQSCHLSPLFIQENMRWGEGGADEAMGPSIIRQTRRGSRGFGTPGCLSLWLCVLLA